MSTLIGAVRELLAGMRGQSVQHHRRRDPDSVGRSSVREIENASPERAGELAGHAVERVET
jgi:hypothetical protein